MAAHRRAAAERAAQESLQRFYDNKILEIFINSRQDQSLSSCVLQSKANCCGFEFPGTISFGGIPNAYFEQDDLVASRITQKTGATITAVIQPPGPEWDDQLVFVQQKFVDKRLDIVGWTIHQFGFLNSVNVVDSISLGILRKGKKMDITLDVEERPIFPQDLLPLNLREHIPVKAESKMKRPNYLW